MKRGREILETFEEKLREHRDLLEITTRCAFCTDTHTGTLEEGRDWHRDHRTKHPQAKRTAPKRTRISFINGSNVHDNLANVRAQGGAQWENET